MCFLSNQSANSSNNLLPPPDNYFGTCTSELFQLVPLSYSCTCYSHRLHDLSFSIPRCYKDIYVNSFFPCTGRLWTSLVIECFPLIYGLKDFKSRINRHFLNVGSFQTDFLYALIFLCFLFL